MSKVWRYNSIVALTALCVLGFWVSAAAADTLGERHTFFVDRDYDAYHRTSVPATLVAVGEHAYVYIEDAFLDRYGGAGSSTVNKAAQEILSAFDTIIYPRSTAFWGAESDIDNDPHVTILFHQLTANTGGYTDTGNLYPLNSNSSSNQQEIIVVAADTLFSAHAEVFLAHEFEHLISANQKTFQQDVVENTWLDELRAQYSITLTGYNTPFAGSDLAARRRDFINNPTDSITQWAGLNVDYAPVTLFGEYLVEQYGPGILQDTLEGRLVGIPSIDAWLAEHKYPERFVNVFGNWIVANYLNKASVDSHFGYKDPNLATIRVSPTDARFLEYPTSMFTFSTEPWQPKWYKFVLPGNIPPDQNVRVSWTQPGISMMYVDDQGTVQSVINGTSIKRTPGMLSFTLMPFGPEKLSLVELNIGFTTEPPAPAVIPDGTLIKRPGEAEMYVVEGKYKRYLAPGVIALYGHLDPSKAVELDAARFDSYISANYVRSVNDKKVYAVWPDGTKHWLNMSATTFTNTGRDWNSIFIINDAELNFYKLGPAITS